MSDFIFAVRPRAPRPILWAAAAYLRLDRSRVWPLMPVAIEFAIVPILAALCVCTLGQAPALVRAVFSWTPLTQLGIWSYSIYLWQQPFSRLARDGVLPAWAALSLGVLFGIGSFYVIEQPARRFLNARWRTLPAQVPAEAAAVQRSQA